MTSTQTATATTDDLRTARIVTAVVLIIAWITAVWIITLYTVLA